MTHQPPENSLLSIPRPGLPTALGARRRVTRAGMSGKTLADVGHPWYASAWKSPGNRVEGKRHADRLDRAFDHLDRRHRRLRLLQGKGIPADRSSPNPADQQVENDRPAAGKRRKGRKHPAILGSRRITTSTVKDPYVVLNVSRNATQDEINAAYRKLAQMYHPDKVAGLAPEIIDIAEQDEGYQRGV